MSYNVANQPIPADTSAGKPMGSPSKSGGKGYLAAPGSTDYQQVSAGTAGPATGVGKGMTMGSPAMLPGMVSGIFGAKKSTPYVPAADMGTGRSQSTRKTFL